MWLSELQVRCELAVSNSWTVFCSSVRVSVYRTLELWLQLVGASANVLQGASSHAELLFTHLLADITPGAESIKVKRVCTLNEEI